MNIYFNDVRINTMKDHSSVNIGTNRKLPSSIDIKTENIKNNPTIRKAYTSKVTVVIPTYNRAKQLPRTVNSVIKQTFPDWSLLIIDDSSTDQTMSYIQKIVMDHKRITYFRLPMNVGLSHVMNRALQVVDSEYILQLDSDDWLEKNALKELVKIMEKNPHAALAYGNHTVWYGKGKKKVQQLRPFKTSDKYQLLVYKPSLYPRFYRTDHLRKIGGWTTNDEFGGRFMEDRRMMLKLIEKYDFAWVNKNLYNLSRGDSIPRSTSFKNRPKYAKLKKDLIQSTLKRWGNKYIPKFRVDQNGWVRTQLIPRN